MRMWIVKFSVGCKMLKEETQWPGRYQKRASWLWHIGRKSTLTISKEKIGKITQVFFFIYKAISFSFFNFMISEWFDSSKRKTFLWLFHARKPCIIRLTLKCWNSVIKHFLMSPFIMPENYLRMFKFGNWHLRGVKIIIYFLKDLNKLFEFVWSFLWLFDNKDTSPCPQE